MKKMKNVLTLLLAVSILASMNLPCYASDNAFKDTFESAFYGGLAGALVGGALLVFTKHPKDHLDYMGYGAAGGILVGATYGIVKTTRALAEYDNGKVKFALPTIMPELRENASTGQTSLAFNAQILRGKF